jgi:hypothetical protein
MFLDSFGEGNPILGPRSHVGAHTQILRGQAALSIRMPGAVGAVESG